MALERLSKLLSRAGIASRRKSEEIILAGRVKVNDITILVPQFQVSDSTDVVTIDNKRVSAVKCKLYVALNKPVGYISDLSDPKGRKLARELIRITDRIYPVGRLDYSSEGLMIFTNDGSLANKIMHPRYGVEKEYVVKVKGALSKSEIHAVVEGVLIEGEKYSFKNISFLKTSLSNTWYSVMIDEGKNRMIRKVGAYIGHPVLKLRRVRIGSVLLGDLKPGESRFLTREEVFSLSGGKSDPGTTRTARKMLPD